MELCHLPFVLVAQREKESQTLKGVGVCRFEKQVSVTSLRQTLSRKLSDNTTKERTDLQTAMELGKVSAWSSKELNHLL